MPERGVDLRCGEPVNRVEYTNPGFVLDTTKSIFFAKNLVIATGGVSYPKTGSTGDGYRLAASLGHSITGTGPALTPLVIGNFPFADLAGMSFRGLAFSVWRENRKTIERQGDVLFTHTGLSGPGILDCSRDIRAEDEIRLSLPVRCSGTHLRGSFFLPSPMPLQNLSEPLYQEWGCLNGWPAFFPRWPEFLRIGTGAHLTAAGRTCLISQLVECPLKVLSLGDLSVAMVTRGGIALEEVHAKTMESRQVRGLFFAGEVLDIDGDTGGFNLQAAFSTGFLAAQGINKRIGEHVS